MAIRQLSSAMLLAKAHHIAQRAAFGIAFFALGSKEAYGGDIDKVLTWLPDTAAKLESWAAGSALLKNAASMSVDEVMAEAERVGPRPGDIDQIGWLRAQIFGQRKCPHSTIPQFMVVWATANHRAGKPSLDAAFKRELSNCPKFLGPVVLLDQEALGLALVDRVGVLARVEIDDGR